LRWGLVVLRDCIDNGPSRNLSFIEEHAVSDTMFAEAIAKT